MGYVWFGIITTMILFGGLVAVQLNNLPNYKDEVVRAVTWTTHQMGPASHVFTVLVFVSSKLLLKRQPIQEALPHATAKWSASRWLLMAPLQLAVFKQVMTINWALLMHTSLLVFQSFLVMVYNAMVFEEDNYRNVDNYEALD